MIFLHESVISSIFPHDAEVKGRIEKSDNEVDIIVQCQEAIKMVKIINVGGIKEKKILKFFENNSLILDCCLSFIYYSKILQINSNIEYMILSQKYYLRDLEDIIQNKPISESDICSVICRICTILTVFRDYNLMVSNLKSSNIIYEEDDEGYDKLKICDLFLNELKKEEDMRIYDVCFTPPEELNGFEYNERSVIWSIGCILYEMIRKKLPFCEDNFISKTKENILRCKYSLDVKCDDEMKEVVDKMLKVKSEDRMSLKELQKEMIKMSKIPKDDENDLVICKERKEMIYDCDNLIVRLPIIYPSNYYVDSYEWKKIRDYLIESYNSKSDERKLSILLMMKLRKGDYSMEHKLKFQILHICREGKKSCCLDERIFRIETGYYDIERVKISPGSICLCEEGIDFFYTILKLTNPTKLRFNYEYNTIPIQYHYLLGSYICQFTDLQEIDVWKCHLTFHFIESFVKSIPLMKLKILDFSCNRIGPKGFKLLLPHLHLLVDREKILNLYGMNLNDESMVLLSEELYKYGYVYQIDIKNNKNIHSKGLKALFSVFSISRIEFDYNGSRELLIDKSIPELIKYIECLNLNNSEIDDDFFKSFISFRSNELKDVKELKLSNNKLTQESIEIMINNISSFTNLKELMVNGNQIGDEGMKTLSPYLHLINNYTMNYSNKYIDCSFREMGLSSVGLRYLLDGLNNITKNIMLDISGNNIDSDGIEYLMKYMKEENNIGQLCIHNNPIGNNGFKLILDILNILVKDESEMNLSNMSIDDESIMLLTKEINSIRGCSTIKLSGNNESFKGLKAICCKSLEDENYPFIELKCSTWTSKELEHYLYYCSKKERKSWESEYDFSNMNINDSHMSLIRQIEYKTLDLSNNRITSKGLKKLTDSLPEDVKYISIHNNNIGDEGVKIICKYLDKFVQMDEDCFPIILNLSNIRMSEKGLKLLIERLKDYKQLEEINLLGNELNENELRLMKENKEVFDCLEEMSIFLKEDIDKLELKSFLQTFSSIGRINLDGISEEERIELSKTFVNCE